MRKLLLILLVFPFVTSAQSPMFKLIQKKASGGGPFANGYNHYVTLTINHTLVPSDQTSYPIVYFGTNADLKTVANGGQVTDAQGDDVIFTNDLAGVTTVPFIRTEYVATTGQYEFEIKSDIHTAADDVIYMWYGNSSVTTYQGSTSTYTSGHLGVFNFPDGTTLSATDATSNANNGTISGATATSGKVGGAANFNGTTDNITWGTAITPGSTFTVQMWLYPIPSSDGYGSLLTEGDNRGLYYRGGSMKFSYYDITDHLNTTALTENAWNYVAVTGNGTSISLYLNGSPDGSATYTVSAIAFDHMGDASGDSYKGKIDRTVISNVARSADWINITYSNINSQGSFITTSSQH